MILLSVGDRIHGGEYSVHSRFRRVVNFSCGEHLAAVCEPGVGPGPLNILIQGLRPSEVRDLQVESGVAVINGSSLPFTGQAIYHSRIALHGAWTAHSDQNLRELMQYLFLKAPPRSMACALDTHLSRCFVSTFERAVAERLMTGAQQVATGSFSEAARLLTGCGFGLTPSGDDFLAGTLVALHVIEQGTGVTTSGARHEILEHYHSDNLLSASFVRMAGEGCVNRDVKDLLKALAGTRGGQLQRCADTVLGFGETSGADFMTGLCLALSRQRWGQKGTRPVDDKKTGRRGETKQLAQV